MTAAQARQKTATAIYQRGITRFLAAALLAIDRAAGNGLASVAAVGFWEHSVPTEVERKAVWDALRDLGFLVDLDHPSGIPTITW